MRKNVERVRNETNCRTKATIFTSVTHIEKVTHLIY